MKSVNSYKTIRLYDILALDDGDEIFSRETGSFHSIDSDVDSFFKGKAVQSQKLNTSSTFLVYGSENGKLAGYFTLAIKMLTLKQKVLTSKEFKILSRFGYVDEDSESLKLPAFLIAQLSRNFYEPEKNISGDELISIALEKTKDIQNSSSGKLVFLECADFEPLVNFYERNGFKYLGEKKISKNSKELLQMYRII